MNSNIVSFAFHDRSVRTAKKDDGSIWFCLADCLAAMESKTNITQTKLAIAEALGDELLINLPVPDALGREQDTLFISESGVTFLLTRSRTAAGKSLNKFIHCEVLPSIRKTGGYSMSGSSAPRQLPPVRDAIDYANAIKVLEGMQDSRLKRLLDARLTAELSVDRVNQPQPLLPAEQPKQYTTATVRAAQLGYSAQRIGNGSALGNFVGKAIKQEFRDWQGQYMVWHYEVSDELDDRIHAYFS